MTDFSFCNRFPDSSQAAALILPHVFEAAGRFESALDVGGGIGAWCVALKQLAVAQVRCVDHPDVQAELLIPSSEFIACDMLHAFPPPVVSDLVVCLEFAEHLPLHRSEPLVEFLTASGGVVLFSAAIPGQPSPYHVNEQPAEFWRRLFEHRGYRRFDCVRPRIAGDTRLPYWYRQNLYVFASESEAARRQLRSLPFHKIPGEFELVHSRVLEQYRQVRVPTLRDVPSIVKRSLATRLRSL